MNASTNQEIGAINKYVLYNVDAMQLWVALYEEKRSKWDSDSKEFKPLNDRIIPYLDHLKEIKPMICPNSWVANQIRGNMLHLIITHMVKRMH